MNVNEFFEEFGRFPIPRNLRPHLRQYLLKAGIVKEPYAFFGALFIFSVISSTILHFLVVYPMLQSFKDSLPTWLFLLTQGLGTLVIWALSTLAIIGLIVVTMYAYLDIRIFNRTRKLEDILPEYLEVVSSNLKGGMSFEKSLWMGIKPKFGVLSNEIALAAKKVMTGHDVDIALTEFAQKYDSPMLKRSMNLIISQIQSGGQISMIIDRIVVDLKKTKLLKDEMSASVLTYMIFIGAIVVVISPVLYALSWALLDVISNITQLLGQSLGDNTMGLPFEFSSNPIDPDRFIFPFSYGAVGITAIGSSMIISIIEKGNIRGGIKYIPAFLVSSTGIYYIALQIMSVLSGLIKIS